MDYFSIFIFLITFSNVLSRQVELSQPKDDHRIVGGEEAQIRDYPYQAFILMYTGNDILQCGGTIISDYHILTAAHCIDRIDYVVVRIGSNQAHNGGTTYRSSTFRMHPDYDRRTYHADIAIIYLSRRMSLDGVNAARIRIASMNYYPPRNTLLDISGWGATGENEPTTTTMRATRVSSHSKETCQRLLGNSLITDQSFCAGPLEGGRDACQGDSGGPAKLVNSNIQVGVVSNGFGCARPDSPGVYTNVGSYNAWIRTMTGGLVTFADVE